MDTPSFAALPRIHPRLFIGNGAAARSGMFAHVVSMADSATWVDSKGRMKPGSERVFAFTEENTRGAEFDGARRAFLPKYPAWMMLDTKYPAGALTPYLRAGARWIDRALARPGGGTVLCHCQMGVNRAASAVVAYAVLYRSIDARQAVDYVRRVNMKVRGIPALTPQYNNFEEHLLVLAPTTTCENGFLYWVVGLSVFLWIVVAVLIFLRYAGRNKIVK